MDSKGCEETSKAYTKGKLTVFGTDSTNTVWWMFGPIGVDSVNASNEVVPSIVCEGYISTILEVADEVTDCAAVGL